MKEQNYKTHARLLFGFHGITFLIILAALFISIVLLVHRGITHDTAFYFLAAVGLSLLFYYLRSFATGNQDRIIRAEENFRCYRLTGKTLDERLTRSQIIALRFADDAEYAELSAEAVAKNMNSKEIKQAIKKWNADHHRI